MVTNHTHTILDHYLFHSDSLKYDVLQCSLRTQCPFSYFFFELGLDFGFELGSWSDPITHHPQPTHQTTFLGQELTPNYHIMTANHVPLILELRMTFRMTLKTLDFPGVFKYST